MEQTTSSEQPKKSGSGIKAILVIILLTIAGYFGYNHFNPQPSANAETKDSVSVVAPVVVNSPVKDTAKKVVADTIKK